MIYPYGVGRNLTARGRVSGIGRFTALVQTISRAASACFEAYARNPVFEVYC